MNTIMQAASSSIQELDESTIESNEISIEQESQNITVVSGTPTTMAPTPIMLCLPSGNAPGILDRCQPLGVELSLSLPLIAYIHPTSPLLNVLHVGDVILELDGRRSTELGFEQLNGWFAGRPFPSAADGSSDTDTVLDADRERSILFLPGRNSPYNPESARYVADGLKKHASIVELANCKLKTPITLFSRKETNTTGVITESSDSEAESGEIDQELKESSESITQEFVLSSESTSFCTLYLADDAGDSLLTPDCTPCEVESSSIATPTSQSMVQNLELYMTQVKNTEGEVPMSPSTTATTFSKSSIDLSENASVASSSRKNNIQIIPADFLAPNMNSPDESSASANHPSSPLVFERPSPQPSVSFCEESNTLELTVPPIPLGIEENEPDQIENSTCAASESNSYSENIDSHHEFETLCQSVLEKNGVALDWIESTNERNVKVLPQQVDETEPGICDDKAAIVSTVKETIDEAITDPSMPPATPKSQAEEKDREIFQGKRRKRPAPAIDAIAIHLGSCDEDISTIFGGKYNPALHATNARVEDGMLGWLEAGKCDPNTASQLILSHGLGAWMQFQQESHARKIALEKQDYQMKEERLNLLKRRHRLIEGTFAIFIFVAVIVLIGVLVIVLRS